MGKQQQQNSSELFLNTIKKACPPIGGDEYGQIVEQRAVGVQ